MKQTNYMPELYRFLAELASRQDRQWLKDNKSLYDDLRGRWIADIDRLLANCSQWWPQVKGQTGQGSVYRI